MSRADPILGGAIKRHGTLGITIARGPTPFVILARAVVRQQLSNKAAATIEGRLKVALGGTVTPQAVLAIDFDLMRGAGLSRAKAATLRDLAAKTRDGTIPGFRTLKRWDDDAIIEHLTQVKGVGLWTAQMFLMFSMMRPDVMPAGDYGVRKGFKRLYRHKELPSPGAVLAHAERWRPWRSVAAWYLWRAADATDVLDEAD